jgi:aminoglycoside phosphotransferase family enzyme
MAAELRAALERLDSGDVEERETHISWVFLIGERDDGRCASRR